MLTTLLTIIYAVDLKNENRQMIGITNFIEIGKYHKNSIVNTSQLSQVRSSKRSKVRNHKLSNMYNEYRPNDRVEFETGYNRYNDGMKSRYFDNDTSVKLSFRKLISSNKI